MHYQEFWVASWQEKAKYIFSVNDANGFWDKTPEGLPTRNKAEAICLIFSELLEAMEAGAFPSELKSIDEYYIDGKFDRDLFKREIKDTYTDELADALIRALDSMYGFNLDFVNIDPSNVLNTPSLYRLYEYTTNSILVQAVDADREGDDFKFEQFFNALFQNILKFAIDKVGSEKLAQHMYLKIQYNATRGYKHGKKY